MSNEENNEINAKSTKIIKNNKDDLLSNLSEKYGQKYNKEEDVKNAQTTTISFRDMNESKEQKNLVKLIPFD